ncbi:MAG: SH3 domain-containing protein [Exiguobacterium profundum]|nr:MAG: SH3 domain-containing protein [Exiguobacterium profundum]
MPLVDPAAFQPDATAEVFSLANAQEGLMDLVPDEAAAAALSPDAVEPEDGDAVWAVVMAEAVNVRSGPSTGDGVAGRLVRGDEVMLVGPEQDGWVQVRMEGDGIDGFVAARFLSPLAGAALAAD